MTLFLALAASTLFQAGGGAAAAPVTPQPKSTSPAPDSFVVTNSVNNVLRYDTSGNAEPAAGHSDFVPAQSFPALGMAFGPDGNLYVAGSVGTGAILRYDGVTGASLGVFVGAAQGLTVGVGGGLAFGPDDNLYVAGGFGITRYCGPLKTTCTPGDPQPAPGQSGATFVGGGLPGLPSDLVFGPDNNLYVTTGNGFIPSDAQNVKRYCGPVTNGCTPGDPLPAPSQPPGSAVYANAGTAILKGLAFGPDGHLYTAEASTGVLRFCGPVNEPCVAGTAIPAPGQTGANYASTGSGARGIDFGPDDNLYVAMLGLQGIRRYLGPNCGVTGCEGSPFPAVGQSGATLIPVGGMGNLTSPVYLKFPHLLPPPPPPNPETVLLVATDQGSVLSFDPDTGIALGEAIAPGTGGLNIPTAMAVDENGNLLIGSTDDVQGRVFRYDGSTLAPFGAPGQPPGSALFAATLAGPFDLAFGRDTNLYANLHGTILRYTGNSGVPLPAIGQPGALFAPATPAGGCQAVGDPHCGHLLARGLEFDPQGNLLTLDDDCIGPGFICSGPEESNDMVRIDQSSGGFTTRGMLSPDLPHDNTVLDIRTFVIGPDGDYYFAGSQNSQGFILRFKINDVGSMTGTGLPAPGQPTGTNLPYFVPPGAGGLQNPIAMHFGPAPDDSLYVIDRTLGVLRYRALSGLPFPAAGQGSQSATFIPPSALGGGSEPAKALVFHRAFGQLPPVPAAVDGKVTDNQGNPIENAEVYVGEFILGQQGSLAGSLLVSPLGLWSPAPTTTTGGAGTFSFGSIFRPGATYLFTASPPMDATGLFPNSVIATVPDGATHLSLPNIVLPPATPIPAGTTIAPSKPACVGPPDDATCAAPLLVPVVSWTDLLTLTTQGCPGGGGSASYTLTLASGRVVAIGAMAPSNGTFSAPIGPVTDPSSGREIKGALEVSIAITCPGGGTQSIDFLMYIDPSGRVVDSITGTSVPGATVSLLRSDTLSGAFTPVPAGSDLMAPSNRRNSDLSDARGQYGWDVVPGYYRLQASAPGYTCDAGSPPLGFTCAGDIVESGAFIVPPAVIDLDLPLRFADFTPPALSLPGSVTVPATGSSGAAVTWSAGALDLVDGVVPVVCVPASGSTFPLGTTLVNCSASDAHHNVATGSFTVTVQPSSAVSGEVPGGEGAPGPPLTIAPGPGGTIVLSWSASCFATDVDYAIYEGEIGDFANSFPFQCSTSGATTATVLPSGDNMYYLVVPNTGTVEGSYGRNSASVDRPHSPFACFPQAAVACP